MTITKNKSAAFLFRSLILICLIQLIALSTQAQLSLSGGITYNYSPSLSYGERQDVGSLFSVFGDLEYQQIIGRLQFSSILAGTFESGNLESGYGIHGSLGYNFAPTEQLRVPLMLTAGGSFITYNNGFNGSTSGSVFTDGSPQLGITISPYYLLNEHFALMGAFRYLKGFVATERSQAIDLTNLSIGIRFTL